MKRNMKYAKYFFVQQNTKATNKLKTKLYITKLYIFNIHLLFQFFSNKYMCVCEIII